MIAPRSVVLIDTSAWIEALRVKGDPAIRAQVYACVEEGRAAWCHIVRLELWAGAFAHKLPRLEQIRQTVRDLSTTEQVWVDAYALATRARAKGFTVPATDLLVISCAKVHGAEMLYHDRHFNKIMKL